MLQAVAYYRVSTREQGNSGLGLESQRRSVEKFLQDRDFSLAAEFTDIESGKNNARPGLLDAIGKARELSATLIIAKIDRLSRNAAFIMTLRDSGVTFTAADMPDANTLTVGIMALLAQQERELISSRTKAALLELKARGKKLGKNNLSSASRQKSSASRRQTFKSFYAGVREHITAYQEAGWSYRRIAEQLNKAGSRTRAGCTFTAMHVHRILKNKDGQ